ncbi:heparinase II/III domain-containing protein [Galbibacter mesophilus]|uniref:heparinase II/III domain-containing protein n=1 Tax=Galbibacter mesophilus TaxID=379069 RepID=UPI0019201907|nr:heparinase II/III family protein [Galbibacter mesophilus]MCM5662934.1 heparinase II/III-family protein [Galbibacter mesophilus]
MITTTNHLFQKIFTLFLLLNSFVLLAQHADPSTESITLENPISISYLKKKLPKSGPKLILNEKIARKLRRELKTDPVVQNMYEAIKLNAEQIQKKPLLKREMVGRRLLATSREMLYRMNVLGMVYFIEKDPEVLKRIDAELIAVCQFPDWNPSHFLDVGEMALAVSIGLDWTVGNLPKETQAIAKTALIEKGLTPSFPQGNQHWWVTAEMNWNQVCHGGVTAAAIMIADVNPELAAKTLHRSLQYIPQGLMAYAPDGAYPEGPTYWDYGSMYTVITIAMLESTFGTDFGISKAPGFLESADYRVLSASPTDRFYNYADSKEIRPKNGDITLAWFASKTGNNVYLEKERFLIPISEMEPLDRHAGIGLVWLSQFNQKSDHNVPLAWRGDGSNPVVFIRGGEEDPAGYYLGCKGGKGTNNHGNMDAGSFIFELNGIRWSVDLGIQSYNSIEKTGFNLWDDCQDCPRWTLISKNNFGHSTLSVNNELHKVDGQAFFTEFQQKPFPKATLDMSATFDGLLKSASRTFIKDSPSSLIIEDTVVKNDSTELITWQMMTTAEVEITQGGALLKKDGELLKLENLSHPKISVSIVQLDPPPLEMDKKVENLKRIELRIPVYLLTEGNNTIKVRLSDGK